MSSCAFLFSRFSLFSEILLFADFLSFLHATLSLAGGTWGVEGSGANEDTFPSPVISALDAELTYLQKGWAPVPARLANISQFFSGRFSGFQIFCRRLYIVSMNSVSSNRMLDENLQAGSELLWR